MRLLLVEDEKTLGASLKKALENHAYGVDWVQDGESALAAIENSPFAAVVLASADDLSIPEDVLNVNGGAIALGHPIGMSGTRLALSALLELRRRGGGLAAVSLCGGGAQGDAALLRSLA